LNRYTQLHVYGRCAPHDLVDQATGLTAFGGYTLFTRFQLVQFLQHCHGDGNVVFLKIQQCVWIVDQDVGVEGVEGWSGGL
jgi:hypothetical protein